MEPARKRGRSAVWEHFELLSVNKVRCLICDQQLAYNNNTSSMLRHYRAKHDAISTDRRPIMNASSHGTANTEPTQSRQQRGDAALVNMIIKDSQPFSVVEDTGFREFVAFLDPTYILPSRKALKELVEEKYKEQKEVAKRKVDKAKAVSLTSDTWTSIHMDAYLAVTCHFIDEQDNLSTVLLGVGHFPRSHTAENIAEVKRALMEEWGIVNKVRCLVTDAAANMISCSKILKVRHTRCIAHSLNLVVRKAIDQTPGLEQIRAKARKIVSHFHFSTTAKQKLCQIQTQMGRPQLKLLQEVETRWNSTYIMFQRLFEEKEPVGAALVSLRTDVEPITAEEYHSINECLRVLSPLYLATTELSEEKRVSGSKVIPLVCMLRHSLCRTQSQVQDEKAVQLCTNLLRILSESLSLLETMSVMTIATLLDPRFKAVGFCSQANAQAAVKRLTAECATVIQAKTDITPVSPIPSTSSQQPAAGPSTESGEGLWALLDSHVMERQVRNATADATVEVQRYMADPLVPRTTDPLHFWRTSKAVYPHLYELTLQFLCTPASSVPCERIFSKAGEIVSKKRNRLSPRTVEKILFLNKNQV